MYYFWKKKVILREIPFDSFHVSQQELQNEIKVNQLRPRLPVALCPELRDIIESGWSGTPTKRPSVSELVAVLQKELQNNGGTEINRESVSANTA